MNVFERCWRLFTRTKVIPGEKFDDDDELAQNVYYVPLLWAAEVVHKAKEHKRVVGDYAVKTLLKVCHEDTCMHQGWKKT